MVTRKKRPRGRRPGTPTTPDEILAAARTSFGTTGYAGTSLRTIADRAGVDVALIGHYFGTKRALFDRVVACDAGSGEAVRRCVETDAGGAAIVGAFVELYDARSSGALGALLRAAADDLEAQRLVGELIARTIVEPVRMRLDRTRSMTRLRAEAVAAVLTGIAWSRYVLRREPFASASPELLGRVVGPAIDAISNATDFAARPKAPGAGRS